jgi:hypothetical protein
MAIDLQRALKHVTRLLSEGAIGVGCCGCNRLLTNDGTVIGLSDFSRFSELAAFTSQKAADAAAEKAGWQVKDKKGQANHRCPSCRRKKRDNGKVGAYNQGFPLETIYALRKQLAKISRWASGRA